MSLDQKFSFLEKFSEEEFILNGHDKDNAEQLINIFSAITPYIQQGKYLELGCGTAMLCRFIQSFSYKSVVPFGVDNNEKAIEIAKKNFETTADNFTQADYFSLEPEFFKDFKTISVFMTPNDTDWMKLPTLLGKIQQGNPEAEVIIFTYDRDFTTFKDSRFEALFSKYAERRVVNKNILLLKNQ